MAQTSVTAPQEAFYGANQADIAAQGWKLVGSGPGAYYARTVDDPSGPNLPGSGGGGPSFGAFGASPSSPPPTLDPWGSFSTKTGAGGSAGPPPGAAPGAPGKGPGPSSSGPGSSGSGSGGSAALNALRNQAGMSGGGLGAPAYGASYGDVAAPSLGSAPNDQAAPVAPSAASAPPPDIATGQALSAPGAMRQNIGQRIPPSLAALLHSKVY